MLADIIDYHTANILMRIFHNNAKTANVRLIFRKGG